MSIYDPPAIHLIKYDTIVSVPIFGLIVQSDDITGSTAKNHQRGHSIGMYVRKNVYVELGFHYVQNTLGSVLPFPQICL
jgi:hypothetical protein